MPCLPRSPLNYLLRQAGTASLLVAACLWALNAVAAPVVAVSIKPLEHLVAALTEGVTSPQLVVQPGQDPHHISLRPSERRVLADADLLVWVGPAMELPLEELVQQIDGRVLTAQTLPDMQLVDAHPGADPHLWLDTRNAQVIAVAVVQQLLQLDPDNRQHYEANLAAFRAQMQAMHAALLERAERGGVQAWAVYHHAFRYTQAEFGLPAPLLLRDSDNVEPGLRSVLAFRAGLHEAGLACLVVEPGTPADELAALLDDASLRTEEVDVLGINRAVQAGSFAALLEAVFNGIQRCAGAAHE